LAYAIWSVSARTAFDQSRVRYSIQKIPTQVDLAFLKEFRRLYLLIFRFDKGYLTKIFRTGSPILWAKWKFCSPNSFGQHGVLGCFDAKPIFDRFIGRLM